MSGDLSVVKAKLDRAKFHADQFQITWETFVNRGTYGFTFQPEGDPVHTWHFMWDWRDWTADEVEQFKGLGLIYGDMLNNLRATLDYLVWQLVLENNRTPTERNSFPCVRSQDKWASARDRSLTGVNGRWRDEIEKLQPFRQAELPVYRHLFAVLDSLNNVNKHRELQAQNVTFERFPLNFSNDRPRRVSFENWLDRPAVNKAEFYRMSFDPPMGKTEMTLDTNPPLRVSFGDGLDHSDGWGYTNADLVNWVSDSVAVFEPAFSGG